MPEDVNPKRAYNAAGRRARAQATRQEIIDVAGRLFAANGYASTAVADIAREANVSPETIYKSFASKSSLLGAVIRASIRGDAEATPLRERRAIEEIRRQQDPGRQLEMYGSLLAKVNPRLAPLFRVMREAAPGDPEIARELGQLNADRLQGMTEFAALLAQRGSLRAGISSQEARDVLWSLNSPELYELLVSKRGWSARRYGRWIAQALRAALLG